MAHLFLAASKMAAPDDGKTIVPRMPAKSAMKPSSLPPHDADKKAGTTAGKDAAPLPPPPSAAAVLINEAGLAAATGGAEASCYRCTVPFGVVVLIAGAVVTGVAYAFNAHGSTISVLGLAMLSLGLALLAASALCWRIRSRRKRWRQQQRDTRRESQTALIDADA